MRPGSHIKRAAKPWTCATCGGEIARGESHFCRFGGTLPYGRYITTMVEKRFHLRCATPVDADCCLDGPRELAEAQR